MMRVPVIAAALLILAGCGKAAEKRQIGSLSVFDVEPTAFAPAMPGITAPPAASGPQVAYTHKLGYILGSDAIAPVQAKAVALCGRLGPRRCLVAGSDLARDPGAGSSGSLSLLIDARLAPRFGTRLDGFANDAGGSSAERHVAAEDVTKQIIDTGARVRAKQALADRLLTIIRTANGRVGDLVAAEKSYAEVQEELDAARSLEAELRLRVAMAKVDITYTSLTADTAWTPVGRARDGLAGSFASSIAALVTFVVVAIPWALLLALVVWLVRRSGWRPRLPFRRRAAGAPPIA